jgi:ribonucleoside-diphosphate reductase beta chain
VLNITKFWTAQEIPVEKDVHDYKQNLTAAQLNLATITLQIFVEIEQKVGDVWEEIAHWYPHSEIEGCCTQIASMEKSVHAFFYQKMSDVMNIDPEETAKNQQTIAVLKDKLQFLQQITSNLPNDKLLSLATVALIEQVLLFSNFAMLKSFRSNGNNFIPNTVTGVDFVIFDEQKHGEFATYLYNTHKAEHERHIGPLPSGHYDNIIKLVQEIIAHEDAMIDYSFAGETSINGITADQLKTFIRSRANEVLTMFGYDEYYTVDSNPIGDWFYKGSKSIKVHDFFAGVTNQYRRGWSTDNFSRLPHLKGAQDE